MQKRILVTGGAGFIGSHIARRLMEQGHYVLILDNLSTGSLENLPKSCDFVKIDLGKPEEIEILSQYKIDVILHLAGQSSGEASFDNPVYDFNSHVTSTFYLLRYALKSQINRFIYASSMATYGDPRYLPVDEAHPPSPKTFYGAGKISAESYISLYHSLGIDTTCFRMFNVYGPGQNLENKKQGMISIYLSYLLENRQIVVKGSSERFRDFIYIDDVVDVWIGSLFNPITYGETYNLATGIKTCVRDIVLELIKAFGYKDYPVIYQDPTPGDQFGLVADVTKLKNDLKWSPQFELARGIRLTVEYELQRRL